MESDRDLVEQVTAAGPGDLRAFDELVRRHQGKVLANCRYMTRASADAEDLAQEVFIRAYFGLRAFRGDAAFGTWVRRIKVNHCLNYLTKQQRKPVEVDVEGVGVEADPAAHSAPTGESNLESQEDQSRIEAVLDGMTDNSRIALLMRDLDEMSYAEIAETLHVGLSAAKMRVKRGREDFRARYRARYDDPGHHAERDA